MTRHGNSRHIQVSRLSQDQDTKNHYETRHVSRDSIVDSERHDVYVIQGELTRVAQWSPRRSILGSSSSWVAHRSSAAAARTAMTCRSSAHQRRRLQFDADATRERKTLIRNGDRRTTRGPAAAAERCTVPDHRSPRSDSPSFLPSYVDVQSARTRRRRAHR